MAFDLTPEFLSHSIGRIYDCAVDPTLWESTLCQLRDEMDLAFIHLFFADPPDQPCHVRGFLTPWDDDWLQKLQPLLPLAPGLTQMSAAPVDSPISQMDVLPADQFFASEFYTRWVSPAGLEDGITTTLLRRRSVQAWVFATTRRARGQFTRPDHDTFRLLAPHIRRALLIGDLIDAGRFQLVLQRKLLNQLSIAIFLVDHTGKIILSNAQADQMLGEGATLIELSGRLRTVSPDHRPVFQTTLERACRDESALATWGNGMALPGIDTQSPAVAYFLPLGKSDTRNALGPGQAAIFVSTGQKALPPSVEILSAMTGLTMAEARVALDVARGIGPAEIADAQQISVHTVRKHLANTYEKTDLKSQTALAAFVNRFHLPLN